MNTEDLLKEFFHRARKGRVLKKEWRQASIDDIILALSIKIDDKIPDLI